MRVDNQLSRSVFMAVALLLIGPLAAAAEAPAVVVERPGSFVRHDLRLPGVLRDGSDLLLHLGVQDGRVRQPWAWLPSYGLAAKRVDAEGLRVADERFAGTVQVTWSYPGEERVYLASIELDLAREGAVWSGDFSSRSAERGPLVIASKELVIEPADLSWSLVGGQELSGEVTGSVGPVARAEGRVVAEIETDCIVSVKARVARWGKARVVLTFQDGVLVEASAGPRKFDKFAATVAEAEGRIVDDSLQSVLQLDVTGEAVVGGRHELRIDGVLAGNSVGGNGVSHRDGKQVNPFTTILGSLERVDDAPSDVTRVVRADMPKAAAGRTNPTLEVVLRDGAVVSGSVRGYIGVFGEAVVDGLRLEGDRLHGPVTMQFLTASALVRDTDRRATYDIDLRLGADGQVTGRYSGQWGEVREVAGSCTGTMVGRKELAASHAIDPAYDWPSWVGPHQDTSGATSGVALVGKLDDARLVWSSERTSPGRSQVTRYGESNLQRYMERGVASGGSTPILYDGKVYFFSVQPGKSPPDPQAMQGMANRGARTLPLLWATSNDDVLLCLDAATGATLWRAVVPDAGGYEMGLNGSTKRGAYTAWPCAGMGRVFVTGSGGEQYAFDADSGELQWRVPHGRNEMAQVIDGVLVTSRGRGYGNGDLIGRDVSNGRILWEIPDAGSDTAVALHWRHDGTSWAVANDLRGIVRCIDPHTGKVQWTIEGLGDANDDTMSLHGDLLIVHCQREQAAGPLLPPARPARGDEKSDGVMVAYRLTTQGAERLWARADVYSPKRELPPQRDGICYFRSRESWHLFALDATSGSVVGDAPISRRCSGPVQLMGDRLFIHIDPTHGHTDFDYYALDGKRIEVLQLGWQARHVPTTGYWPVVGRAVLADGRMILRGSTAIHCYDLRRPD